MSRNNMCAVLFIQNRRPNFQPVFLQNGTVCGDLTDKRYTNRSLKYTVLFERAYKILVFFPQ